MTRRKRRLRRTFRRWASMVFWTSPLWSFPAAFATMQLGLLPVEAAFILFVGVLPAMMWIGIRVTGFVAVRMTRDEHRKYARSRTPLEIKPGSEELLADPDDPQAAEAPVREARPGNGGAPSANATIN